MHIVSRRSRSILSGPLGLPELQQQHTEKARLPSQCLPQRRSLSLLALPVSVRFPSVNLRYFRDDRSKLDDGPSSVARAVFFLSGELRTPFRSRFLGCSSLEGSLSEMVLLREDVVRLPLPLTFSFLALLAFDFSSVPSFPEDGSSDDERFRRLFPEWLLSEESLLHLSFRFPLSFLFTLLALGISSVLLLSSLYDS